MEELGAILETGSVAAVELAASALAERGAKTGICPNCKAPLIGPYCAVCGQPHDGHRRSVSHLLHDFFKDIISFDSRILRTARALVAQPGELPLAFRDGRTQRYVPPVRLYLFVSLLFFLFLSVTGIAIMQLTLNVQMWRVFADKGGNVYTVKDGKQSPMSGFKADAKGNVYLAAGDLHKAVPGMKADGSTNYTVTVKAHYFQRIGSQHPHYPPEVATVLNSLKAESEKAAQKPGNSLGQRFGNWIVRVSYSSMQKLDTNPAALNEPLTAWIPRILFLLLPLFALLLVAFYWRRRKEFYFVDHMVFSLTLHTFGFVALIVAAILAQILPGGWVTAFLMLVLSVYLLLSLKRFYGQSWLWTCLKFVGVGFIYTSFFLMPALAAAIVVSVVSA
jgi:hypothetical protein